MIRGFRGKVRIDHGHYRPGWRLSGGVAAAEGLHGARRETTGILVQYRSHRPSLSRSARGRHQAVPALRRSDGCDQPDPHHSADPTRRNLQPGSAEPRRGIFETPEYTANADALGTLRILEAIRLLGLGGKTRFYQASTSEMYGKVQETPQRETTPFYPRSPYGAAKVYAYWITVNYREAYGMYAWNGILFNHESPVRGETFVTRKITRGTGAHPRGCSNACILAICDSLRDWGHARDYVRAQWLMLQQASPRITSSPPANSTRCANSSSARLPPVGMAIEWRGARYRGAGGGY